MGRDRLVIKMLRALRESNLYQLPAELKELVWDGNGIGGKEAVAEFNERFGKCAICGFKEVLDWHHLMVVDYNKPPMQDGSQYEFCLGLIRLCPNHHASVHRVDTRTH